MDSDTITDDQASGSGNTFNGILTTVRGLGDTASNVIKAVNGSVSPAATAAPSASMNWQKYLPYIIGGAVLLFGALFLLGRRK